MSTRRLRDTEQNGTRAAAVPTLHQGPTLSRGPTPAVDPPSYRDPRMTEAIRGLWLRQPEMSARGGAPAWLLPAALVLTCLLAFGAAIDPTLTLASAGVLLLVPFAGATGLRLAAAIEILVGRPAGAWPPAPEMPRARGPSFRLPRYSVLVPLYDEAAVLPQLVFGLSHLAYPSERLEILLVLEARDRETRNAAANLRMPANMRVVVVPRGGPRTKPKALNYALTFATGELVVVYDAEDRPEPGQLHAAASEFARAGPDLACVQARLNIYNPAASFFTRQFTLEYSALFDGLLPALARLGLPIPLGGTSNHFRMQALRAAGAWDPYNVTEDADLGIRLARMGYRTATIASTTWEEAPTKMRDWFGQRTRWLKGWLQTWMVHMRRPGQLLRDLGAWRFAGLQLVMGGVLLSALAHPLFVALAAGAMFSDEFWPDFDTRLGQWLWWIAMINLGLGMLAPALAAGLAVVRRGRVWLLPWVLVMPVYWLAISIAGYRALIELARRPFHWEKTRHGIVSSRQPPQ